MVCIKPTFEYIAYYLLGHRGSFDEEEHLAEEHTGPHVLQVKDIDNRR